jgi:hypothetical protein
MENSCSPEFIVCWPVFVLVARYAMFTFAVYLSSSIQREFLWEANYVSFALTF